MSPVRADTGVGRTSIACQCASISPGISTRPPPLTTCASAVIAAAEILSILLLRTRTLDGGESAPFFPSKMRTFWNRTAGLCCARAGGQAARLMTIDARTAAIPKISAGFLKPDMPDLRKWRCNGARGKGVAQEDDAAAQLSVRGSPLRNTRT